jgi:2-dehydro-3-deoxyphosphogluconate aldolase/(4S)-4-hydroxy-2-oxoglutarate aldolase
MMLTRIEKTAEQVRKAGVIAIIRGTFSVEDMLRIADALREGGITLMEVTLNSTDALRAVSTLRQRCGDKLLIGAGTVRTVTQAEAALAAGAQFVVSPNFDPALSSIAEAHMLSATSPLRPRRTMRSWRAPMVIVSRRWAAGTWGATRAAGHIEFVPTGGIRANNLAEYVRAGAAAVAVGSSLVSDKDWSVEQIRSRAEKLRAAWEAVKGKAN